jgi:hypothetical protein
MELILGSPILSPALAILAIYTLYKYVVYPLWFSPLAKIPNAHPLAPVSSIWINWIRFLSRENRTLEALHRKHGSVVRLGPSELSVNCIDGGVKTIYGKGFDKPAFYSVFENYG